MTRTYLSFWVAVLSLFAFSVSAQAPTFSFESGSANPGQTIEVDLTVSDFENILTMQFSVGWDSMVLELDTLINFSTVEGAPTIASIGTSVNPFVDKGRFTLSWEEPDSDPLTLNDNTVLFTIRYTVVGAECSSTDIALTDDPLSIEILDGSVTDVGANVDNGTVEIPGDDCGGGGGDLVLDLGEVLGEPGSQVCVPMICTNFDDINSMQFGMTFDPQVLEYVGLDDIGITALSNGNIGVNQGTGTLTLVWADPQANGETLPDGSTVFSLCFDIIGEVGDVSPLGFSNTPLIEISNASGQVLMPNLIAGEVQVVNSTDVLTFSLPDISNACPGALVKMPITMENFEDIASLQLSVNYDPSMLMYSDIILPSNVLDGLSLTDITVPPTIANGSIHAIWLSQSSQGISFPDGDTLFCIQFEVIGDNGQSSDVNFGETLELECVSGNSDPVPCIAEPGSVSVNCAFGCSEDMIIDAECDGDDMGSIFVSVFGGSGDYSYLWSDNTMTEDLIGAPIGSYTLMVTDNQTNMTESCGPFAIEQEFGISDMTSVTADDCGGGQTGSIQLEICGTPTSIAWTLNGAFFSAQEDLFNLGAGIYEVTIQNASGAQVTNSYEIIQQSDAMLTDVNISEPTPGQMDGAIDITVSGSNAPFTYMWDNGSTAEDLNGIGMGCYNLRVTDAQGCQALFGPYCLGGDGSLELNIVTSDYSGFGVSCNESSDGTIDVTPVNGVAPYTYEWSNPNLMGSSLSGLPAGAYGLTVTSADGAMVETVINITEPTPIIVNFNNQCAQDEQTNDGAFVAVVSGGASPYSYSWNGQNFGSDNTFGGQLAGTQVSLSVRDANGCQLDVPAANVPPICIDGGACFTSTEVISPNGDGLNDFLRISCIASQNAALQVFDNAGERIYTVDNYLNDWPSGSAISGLDDNVYYWVLTVTNTFGLEQVYTGYVTVLQNLD